VNDRTPALSLGEGDTPLVNAEKLSQEVGAQVWLKVGGCNPTGSFKDRGMVVAVAKAVEEGSRAVVCASTGNTSASAAAYAAKATIEAVVGVRKLAQQGRVPEGGRLVGVLTGSGLKDAELAVATVARKLSVAGQPTVVPVSSKGVQTKVVKRREHRRHRGEAEDHR